MLNTFVPIIGPGLAICAVFFILAKRTVPITVKEAKVMWMMHRKTTSCRGHRWKPIKHREDKIVGFRCECGYKYTQKQPLLCRSLKHSQEHSEQINSLLFLDH